MKKAFPLERVREIKGLLRDKEEGILAQLVKEEIDIKIAIDKLSAEIDNARSHYYNLIKENKFDYAEMQNSYIFKLQRDKAQLTINYNAAIERTLKQREVLAEAHKSKKVLERLKSKHVSAYNSFLEKEESKELDEIASRMHIEKHN